MAKRFYLRHVDEVENATPPTIATASGRNLKLQEIQESSLETRGEITEVAATKKIFATPARNYSMLFGTGTVSPDLLERRNCVLVGGGEFVRAGNRCL